MTGRVQTGGIRLRGVSVQFDHWGATVRALDGIDLDVPPGQWLALVGPNGSGKSTLLHVINGRQLDHEGETTLDGLSPGASSAHALAMSVFLVHQDPLLGTAPALTVYENLLVADEDAPGVRRAVLEARYRALLSPVGLSDRLRQPAGSLSGGERQLLAITIAALRPCKVVLLDEPLAALDPTRATTCLEAIAHLHALGKTVIQVTHDPRLAPTLGDRTVALRAGRVVYDGTGAERDPKRIRACWHEEDA